MSRAWSDTSANVTLSTLPCRQDPKSPAPPLIRSGDSYPVAQPMSDGSFTYNAQLQPGVHKIALYTDRCWGSRVYVVLGGLSRNVRVWMRYGGGKNERQQLDTPAPDVRPMGSLAGRLPLPNLSVELVGLNGKAHVEVQGLAYYDDYDTAGTYALTVSGYGTSINVPIDIVASTLTERDISKNEFGQGASRRRR